MKKLLLFTSLILLVSVVSQSQWGPDYRLTYDGSISYASYNNARCVAASGDLVHCVWYDRRDGNYEIYYKRSTDAGISWDADTRLTIDPQFSGYPSVAVSGSTVHVVWLDSRYGSSDYEIYYKLSTDGGISWGTDTRLSKNTGGYPSVAVSGSVVHVVYFTARDGNREIYYKRSTNGGISWGGDTRLTYDAAPSELPSVSVSGSNVYIVWDELRDGNREIYFKSSTDFGTSWGADKRLTNDPAISGDPCVTVYASSVYVAWADDRDGNNEIYYKRSIDGGISWGADKRLTFSAGMSIVPSVSASGSIVHVVWYDDRDLNYEIYYKRSTDGGSSWEKDTRLTFNSASSVAPSVSVSGAVVHVVWQESRDGNYEIYYKQNSMGSLKKSDIPIGIQAETNSVPLEFSLEQNYPNPFNPSTTIKFSLPVDDNVVINVCDITGREVAELINQKMTAGYHEIKFDGSGLSSGAFFYKIVTSKYTDVKKMLMVK